MVAIMITRDILHINKCRLNLNEYLTLLKIKHDEENESFPYEIDHRYVMRLVKEGFIEVDTNKPYDDTKSPLYKLGPESNKVFKIDDLFEEFYEVFPHRVETEGGGFRAISAKDPNSLSAQSTRNIWNRMTKNKPSLQLKIIECLKRELEHRKTHNSLAFLQGIDTWLRQATWEKWEDIPDKNNSKTSIKL